MSVSSERPRACERGVGDGNCSPTHSPSRLFLALAFHLTLSHFTIITFIKTDLFRIIFTGSGFDIFSDQPKFPFVVNAIISAGGLSLCLGFFYASILKAQAETEEDDKRYMNGR